MRAKAGAAVPSSNSSMARTAKPCERYERSERMVGKVTRCPHPSKPEWPNLLESQMQDPDRGPAPAAKRPAGGSHRATVPLSPMETPERRMPVTVYAEDTPNPATLRFVASRSLVPEGRIMEFATVEEAEAVSPLAAHVFNLPFVTGVFISGNFISVTKNDSIDWDLVQVALREHIQDHLNGDGRVVLEGADAQSLADANERAVSHAKPTSALEEQIISVLDEYVSPAVAADGGHIAFKSYRDGVLAVSLRGSCSGCPSSLVTLKGGIENLMRQMVPGVKEVVAEEL